ncbi:MAG: hypothetical protein OES26_24630 [Gammaproteobacteria bacterium]|nr:hypothetical protein [Gammaproteobacteria bacterium]
MQITMVFHQGFQVEQANEHKNRDRRRGDGHGQNEGAPPELLAQAAK